VVYSTNSVLITYGGSLMDVETWSIRLRAWSTVPVSDAALVAGIAGTAADFFTDASAQIAVSDLKVNSQATLDFVKVAAIDTDGHYALESDADLHSVAPGTGAGGGGSAFAAQLCTVMTFLTVAHRGHASKGRVFLPSADQSSLESDGQMSVAVTEDMRDAFLGWLNNANGILSSAFSASMRLGVLSNVGAGRAHQTTDLTVGRIIDTQRRRRRSLDEAYVTPAALA
jgi:hypothetical protein